MNISPVSFRNTVPNTGSDFSTFISRPQAYTHKEEPVAATNLTDTKKKKSPLKTILGVALGAAGITAGLALGAKYGIFDPKVGGNALVEKAKAGLKLVGEKILSWGKLAADFGLEQWNKIKTHLPNKEKISEAVNEAVNEAPDFV